MLTSFQSYSFSSIKSTNILNRKKTGSSGGIYISKTEGYSSNQKGNNIAKKWIREVSKRPPLQKF
jgi:hypothetical protein